MESTLHTLVEKIEELKYVSEGNIQISFKYYLENEEK